MTEQEEEKTSIEWLARKFNDLWAGEKPRFFSAPGRVNLIGEHTDYNDGFVLPIALNYRTTVAAARRDDDKIEVYSVNFKESETINLNAAPRRQTDQWINYVEGMGRVLRDKGCKIGGANLLIGSDVPVGSGLSSSAAIEIAVGLALTGIHNIEIDRLQIALAGQLAEHEYVGTKSGIMDQFIVAFGRAEHALLIDCRALEAEEILLKLNNTELIVCNSGIRHDLASSEYNVRRAECEKGVEILRRHLPEIKALRDVSLDDFKRFESFLPEIIRRRCRHIITENSRTLKAAEAFRTGNVERAGQLMSQSHASLRDDYEVSCKELDLLVSLSENFEGVCGARMTGGGFGGCTINLLRREQSAAFVEYIGKEYKRQACRRAEIFRVKACDGAAEIK